MGTFKKNEAFTLFGVLPLRVNRHVEYQHKIWGAQ